MAFSPKTDRCEEPSHDLPPCRARAHSLERRLSLAQTEIKGHMRNESDLLNELALARADWACAQARIAALEKALVQARRHIESRGAFTPHSVAIAAIDAALKDSA